MDTKAKLMGKRCAEFVVFHECCRQTTSARFRSMYHSVRSKTLYEFALRKADADWTAHLRRQQEGRLGVSWPHISDESLEAVMHFVEQCLLAEAWDWNSTTQIIKHGNITYVGDTALSETQSFSGGQPKHTDDSSLANTQPTQRSQLAYQNNVVPTDKQSQSDSRDLNVAHESRVTNPARSPRSGRSDRFNFSRYYDEQPLEGYDGDKSASHATSSGYAGYADTRFHRRDQRMNTDDAGSSTYAGAQEPQGDGQISVGRANHAPHPSHVAHVRMQPRQRGQHSHGSDVGDAANAGYRIQTDYSTHVSYSARASYSTQAGSSTAPVDYNPSYASHSVHANRSARTDPNSAADFRGLDSWPLSRSPVLDPELEPVSEPKTAPAVEFAPKLVSPTGPECRDDVSEAETIWPIVFPNSDVSGYSNFGINPQRIFPPRPPTPTPWGRSARAKSPTRVATGTKKVYGKFVEKVLVDSWAGWWWRRHVRQCSEPQHQPYLDQLLIKDREKSKREWQKRMKARLEQRSRE